MDRSVPVGFKSVLFWSWWSAFSLSFFLSFFHFLSLSNFEQAFVCRPRRYGLVPYSVGTNQYVGHFFSSQSTRPRLCADVSQTARQLFRRLSRLLATLRRTSPRCRFQAANNTVRAAPSPFLSLSDSIFFFLLPPPLSLSLLLRVSRLSRPYVVQSGGRGMLRSSAASQPVQFIH